MSVGNLGSVNLIWSRARDAERSERAGRSRRFRRFRRALTSASDTLNKRSFGVRARARTRSLPLLGSHLGTRRQLPMGVDANSMPGQLVCRRSRALFKIMRIYFWSSIFGAARKWQLAKTNHHHHRPRAHKTHLRASSRVFISFYFHSFGSISSVAGPKLAIVGPLAAAGSGHPTIDNERGASEPATGVSNAGRGRAHDKWAGGRIWSSATEPR